MRLNKNKLEYARVKSLLIFVGYVGMDEERCGVNKAYFLK